MRILALAVVGLLFLSGCNAPPPDQVRKSGATLLYDVLIEIDPATAKKDAQFISTAMSTDIIPFVTNSQLPASQLIPQLRKLLGNKIAGQKYVGAALSIVSMATSFGNININAPKMSDNERAYVLAACNAIQDACDGFLAGKVVHVKLFKPSEGSENACTTSPIVEDVVSPVPINPGSDDGDPYKLDGGCGSYWRVVRRSGSERDAGRQNTATNDSRSDSKPDELSTGDSGRCFVVPKQDGHFAESKGSVCNSVHVDSK